MQFDGILFMHEGGYAASPKLWAGGKTNDLLVSWFVLAKVPVQSKSKNGSPTYSQVNEISKSFGVDMYCVVSLATVIKT